MDETARNLASRLRLRPRSSEPSRKPGGRRKAAALLILAAAIAAAALIARATIGSASTDPTAQARAAGVDAVVAQAQASFGNALVASGAVAGSALTLTLAPTDGPSITIANFEGAVLAHAVADWMTANQQETVTSVRYVDGAGNQLPGNPVGDSVGNEPTATALSTDACATAAQNAPASLTLVSARTLPLAGGTCVFKLTTADPTTFAANASSLLPQITGAIPDANDHSFLVEVDSQDGTPQIMLSWVPAIAGQGQGQAYVRPGLPNTLSWGGY